MSQLTATTAICLQCRWVFHPPQSLGDLTFWLSHSLNKFTRSETCVAVVVFFRHLSAPTSNSQATSNMSDTISRPQCQSTGIDRFTGESRSFIMWLRWYGRWRYDMAMALSYRWKHIVTTVSEFSWCRGRLLTVFHGIPCLLTVH